MSTQTTNYGLTKWAESDPVVVAQINDNFEKLDQAIASLAATVGTKCRIASGTYVGTGTNGEASPTTLNLPFQPKVVFLDCDSEMYAQACLLVYGAPKGLTRVTDVSTYYVRVTWNGTQVSWFSADHAVYQLNGQGYTYRYVAIA